MYTAAGQELKGKRIAKAELYMFVSRQTRLMPYRNHHKGEVVQVLLFNMRLSHSGRAVRKASARRSTSILQTNLWPSMHLRLASLAAFLCSADYRTFVSSINGRRSVHVLTPLLGTVKPYPINNSRPRQREYRWQLLALSLRVGKL